MKAKITWIVLFTLGILVLLLVAVQFALRRADRAANFAFGDKARSLKIAGKSEAFIYEHFGQPDYVHANRDYTTGEPYHVLGYTPGPALCYWNSECKIRIDDKTKSVSGWMINSD